MPEEDRVAPPPADDASPADIAEWATDDERLMPGENPATNYPSDAAHWCFVFQQLIDFKNDVLSDAQTRASAMDDAAAREIRESDIRLLKAERRRFQRRLDFWTARARELAGS